MSSTRALSARISRSNAVRLVSTGSPASSAWGCARLAAQDGREVTGRPAERFGDGGEGLRAAAARVQVVLQLPQRRQRHVRPRGDVHLRHPGLGEPVLDCPGDGVPVLAGWRSVGVGHVISVVPGGGIALDRHQCAAASSPIDTNIDVN